MHYVQIFRTIRHKYTLLTTLVGQRRNDNGENNVVEFWLSQNPIIIIKREN